MSNRITSHDDGKTPQSRPTPDFSKFMVRDSFCKSTTDSSSEAGEEHHRISRQRLEEIAVSLNDRDREVISSIQQFRYLMSSQVQRLHFTDSATPSAALRATNRCLKRLRELGVIDHLSRRIGGVRAGSGSLVWYITHAGERLIYLQNCTLTPTKRFFEPSPYFLAHTLAVADIAVELTKLCRDVRGLRLFALQTEPECWRNYSEYGNILALMLAINALSASDYVLIPVQADYLMAEDMSELVGTVRNIQRQINPELKIAGVFLTMANKTNFRKDIVAAVKSDFRKHLPVMDAVIPATVRLAEISTADKSIFQHEPRGRAKEVYRSLTRKPFFGFT